MVGTCISSTTTKIAGPVAAEVTPQYSGGATAQYSCWYLYYLQTVFKSKNYKN